MTDLILVRHGETDWNREGRFQGHMQTPLNDRGHREAELAAQRLAGAEVDALYCSDLRRARETAWPIARSLGMPIRLREDLRERDVGEMEGLTFDEVSQKLPDHVETWLDEPVHTRPPGGESYADLHERSDRILTSLLSEHTEGRLVVVSHGGTIKGLICAAAGLPPAARLRLHIGTASLSFLHHDGDRGFIERINDRCHLDEMREIKYILVDVDNTLYPKSSGVMNRIGRRILQFMENELELASEEAASIRQGYLRRYGTTLRGLQEDFTVNAGDFLHYVHDFPLDDHLEPDPALGRALAGIEQEKVLFTNSTEEHSRGVLRHLGIEEHFTRIFDIKFLEHVNKPDRGAYRRALTALGALGDECLLIDDLRPNLEAGKAFGMTTVLVTQEMNPGSTPPYVDFVTPSVSRLPEVLERLDG